MNWTKMTLDNEILKFKKQIDIGNNLKNGKYHKPINNNFLNLFIKEFILTFEYVNLFVDGTNKYRYGWKTKDHKFIIKQLKRVLEYGEDVFIVNLYQSEEEIVLHINTNLTDSKFLP